MLWLMDDRRLLRSTHAHVAAVSLTADSTWFEQPTHLSCLVVTSSRLAHVEERRRRQDRRCSFAYHNVERTCLGMLRVAVQHVVASLSSDDSWITRYWKP